MAGLAVRVMAVHRLGNYTMVDHHLDWLDTFARVSVSEKRLVIVHHTATSPTMTLAQLYAAHQQYGGIGYNALVYDTGIAQYVGEWNSSRAGAGQIGSLNWQAYHVALVGNFTYAHPTYKQLTEARALLQNLMYAVGWRMPVVPHCLFNVDANTPRAKWNTVCPGATWTEWWDLLVGP